MHLPTHPERKDIGVDAFMCVCVSVCVGGWVCVHIYDQGSTIRERERVRERVCVCVHMSLNMIHTYAH